MWERDLERLLTLHQAQGKSKEAISKPRRSAPATLAPHNYNTIWQRYWAQIPCYFCGCVYPARTWFYIKVPKMALLTYWKERPWSRAERSKHWEYVDSPTSRRGNTAHGWSAHLLVWVGGCLYEKLTFTSTPPFENLIVTLYRVESERRKERHSWMRPGWGKDTDNDFVCFAVRNRRGSG